MNGAAAIIIIVFGVIILILCSSLGTYSKILNYKNKVYYQFEEIDKCIKEKSSLLSEEEYNKLIKSNYNLLDINNKIEINEKIDKLKINNEKIEKLNDKINYAKEFYNETTTKYNDILDDFPTIIIANIFKFNKYNLIK